MTAIDNTRVELLRDFGSPITLVGATDEEMLVALFRGFIDPEEFLEKPYSPIHHGPVVKDSYKPRKDDQSLYKTRETL